MKSNRTALLLLLATIPGCFNPALAFDKQRKGFILGFSAGFGGSSYVYKVKDTDYKSNRTDQFGTQNDFRIGYAPMNQLEIYYSNKVSWWLSPSNDKKILHMTGLTSAAGKYFFNPEGPSAFVSGGLGLAVWMTPLEADTDVLYGFGFFAGGGYEILPRLEISGDLVWGAPGKKYNSVRRNYSAITVQITVGWTFY
jgi:hypothetical protein